MDECGSCSGSGSVEGGGLDCNKLRIRTRAVYYVATWYSRYRVLTCFQLRARVRGWVGGWLVVVVYRVECRDPVKYRGWLCCGC